MKCSLFVLFTVLLFATGGLGARLKRQAGEESPNAAEDVPAKPTKEESMNNAMTKMLNKYSEAQESGKSTVGIQRGIEIMALKMAMMGYTLTPENQAAMDNLPQEGADGPSSADQQF